MGRPRAAGAGDGQHARCSPSRRPPRTRATSSWSRARTSPGSPSSTRSRTRFEVPVLLKVGDDISTDDISPAGAAALPFRSNIPELARFAFVRIDEDYPANAEEIKDSSGHAIVGGDNYGQGSSREHAAICPRYLGLRVVIAKSFARIHWQNLANFGILALEFADESDYDALEQGATLSFSGVHDALAQGSEVTASVDGREYTFRHQLSARQVSMVLAGGLIREIARVGFLTAGFLTVGTPDGGSRVRPGRTGPRAGRGRPGRRPRPPSGRSP